MSNKQEKDDNFSYIKNISKRLQNIIYLTTIQRDISPMCEDLLYLIYPYMSQDMKDYLNNGEELKDDYDENIHRVRTIVLTLYNIESIPSPNADDNRLKYKEVLLDKGKYGTTPHSVAQNVDFRSTLMYYLEARRRLTEEIIKESSKISNPYHALHFLLDIGFALLSPYVTEDEYDRWMESCERVKEQENVIDNKDVLNESRREKIIIQSEIMDRQKFQMSYRDVDIMGEEPEDENIIEEYKEYKGM